MPTILGQISSIDGTRFAARFLINEIEHRFTGSFTPSVPSFSNLVTLTFSSPDQLTATRAFTGQVGITHIVLRLANGGLTIQGTLHPEINPATVVEGSGIWTSG